MVTKVQKWGNSLGLRLPKALADELHIDPGSEVDLKVVKGRLVLTPVKCASYALKDLLAGVTNKNIHDEIEFDSPIGDEAW
jgi:antitoxin MazE